MTVFGKVENNFITIRIYCGLSLLTDNEFGVFPNCLSQRLTFIELIQFLFYIVLGVMSSIENCLNKFLQLFGIKDSFWVLPDISLMQQIPFVSFLIHASLIISMNNVIMIIFLNRDLNGFITLGKSKQFVDSQLCNQLIITHHVINVGQNFWSGLIQVDIEFQNVGFR